jgi:uncharacterized protein YqgV (UPF0045/DUF77 family)
MNEDVLKKIFTYNIYWLRDEKTVGDVVIQKLEDYSEDFAKKILGGKSYRDFIGRKSVPSYIRGSLIDNSASISLKDSLRPKIFYPDIINKFLDVSKFCVVNDFKRYMQCNDQRLSRPLITFITTKENADKLKYLDKQPIKYEYLSLDYKDIRFAGKENKRTIKPELYKHRTMSDRFNNFLLKSIESNDDKEFFFYIATELGRIRITDKDRIKVRSNFNKEKEKTDENKEHIKNAEKALEEEELDLRLNPDDQTIKDNIDELKEQLKKLRETFYDGTRKLRQLSVVDEYRLESDYYYKKLLERFQLRAENKLKVKLNLNEWSFCIVFSPLWCDVGHIPRREKSGMDLLRYLVSDSSDIKKSFNDKENSSTIDFSLLNYLDFVFKQKKVNQAEIFDKIGELKDFNIVSRAFRDFPNGGYWVKKIVKEKGIFKEKTEGPYSMQEAETKVKILENIISLDGVKTAKMFSFKDLVCNNNLLDLEGNDSIDKYVKVKNRYSPPNGARLFCLVKGFLEVVFFEKQSLTERFRKFSNYAINAGMNYVSIFDYLIYYNPDSNSSVRRVGELKQLLRNRDNYIEDEFLWMVDAVEGRTFKRGKEPELKPFKILSNYENEGKMEYLGLVQLYEAIENYECSNERLDLSFTNFKEAIGEDYVFNYKNPEFDIKSEINLGIVQNEKDDKIKKFKIIKNYDGSWEICMHRFRKKLKDIKLISVKNIKDCKGYLELKFKNLKDKTWEVSKLNLISNDQFFNNEFVLICLTLFVSKCFGVRTIILDNSLKSSECANNILFHYYYIYYIGTGSFKAFEELGFMIENYAELKNVVDNIKTLTIDTFVKDNNLKVKVPPKSKGFKLEDFCKSFITTEECFTNNNLIIINQISAYVNSKVNINIFIDLDEISFDHLIEYISY